MSEKTVKKKEEVAVNDIQDFFDLVKVDLTDIAIGYHDNINLDFEFPMSPEKYLKFAKSDLKDGSEKGLINALSNAKRSIDCLIESVLNSLHINPNSIPEAVNSFYEDVLNDVEKQITPNSLKLFCGLGFAPSILISEVRTLRNKVEHDYVIPLKSDVVKAIEVADLLLNNVKAKEIYSGTIDITDRQSQIDIEENRRNIKGIYFDKSYLTCENSNCTFQLRWYTETKRIIYYFKGNELVYFYFLRSMFIAAHDEDALASTIKSMFNHINTKTPKKYIKISQVYR